MIAGNRQSELIELLATIPYFKDLKEELLGRIGAAMSLRSYQSGEVIFFEGDEGHSLYIVRDGFLKAVKISIEGREQVLQVIGPREVFGAVAVFHSSENPATIIALEPSEVYSIDQETMQRLLESSSELAALLIDNLASRVLHLIKLVEDLSLRSVEARLARLLIESGEQGVVRRHRWTTQAEMAAQLGTVPDVLNRSLRNFVDEGVIELDRHQITIVDPEQLRSKAMLEP